MPTYVAIKPQLQFIKFFNNNDKVKKYTYTYIYIKIKFKVIRECKIDLMKILNNIMGCTHNRNKATKEPPCIYENSSI